MRIYTLEFLAKSNIRRSPAHLHFPHLLSQITLLLCNEALHGEPYLKFTENECVYML